MVIQANPASPTDTRETRFMEQLGVAQFGSDRVGGLEPATYVRNLVYRTKADLDQIKYFYVEVHDLRKW